MLPNVEDRTLTVLYFDLRGRVEYEGLAGFFFPTNVSAFGPPVGYRLATMYLHMKMLGIGLYVSMEMAGLVNRWYLWRHHVGFTPRVYLYPVSGTYVYVTMATSGIVHHT